MNRDLRRLQLLVQRAVTDCGATYPELRELDSLLRFEDVEIDRLRPLISRIETARPGDRDGERCSIIRHNIAVELRDLLVSEPVAHG